MLQNYLIFPAVLTPAVVLRKPGWLKSRIPGGPGYAEIRLAVRRHRLHTVCEAADCPNQGECWAAGTATLMILGDLCTRGCRFCDVPKGRPEGVDEQEPQRTAEMVRAMGLRYAVLTSVARDDLPDGGAGIWARTIDAVRRAVPGCRVEALVPDFQGRVDQLDVVLAANPDVLNHNFETVERLQYRVRGRGNLRDSTAILRHAKARGCVTKTSVMLGLGEERHEVEALIRLAAGTGVDIVTLGQYLRPSGRHLPVARYLRPEEFSAYRDFALENGIRVCEASPLHRSSYRANETADKILGPLAQV